MNYFPSSKESVVLLATHGTPYFLFIFCVPFRSFRDIVFARTKRERKITNEWILLLYIFRIKFSIKLIFIVNTFSLCAYCVCAVHWMGLFPFFFVILSHIPEWNSCACECVYSTSIRKCWVKEKNVNKWEWMALQYTQTLFDTTKLWHIRDRAILSRNKKEMEKMQRRASNETKS